MSINDCFAAMPSMPFHAIEGSLGDFGFAKAIEIVKDSVSAGHRNGASRNS